MKMRKALMALTLALAMCVTGITMTGCGKIDYIGFDSYEGDSEGEMMGSEVTLKQALEANPDTVWFSKSVDSKFSKDLSPKEAYQFKDGKVTRYPMVGLSMGEISKIDPKDLPDAVRTSCYNKLTKYCEKTITKNQEIIEKYNKRYQEGNESAKEIIDKHTKKNQRLEEAMASPETLLDAFVTTTPYILVIWTDDSGNYTGREDIKYKAPEDAYSIRNAIEDGKTAEDHVNTIWISYGEYLGPVYDSEYSGFSNESNVALFTKSSQNTYFTLDEVGTKDILVDPSEKEIEKILKYTR